MSTNKPYFTQKMILENPSKIEKIGELYPSQLLVQKRKEYLISVVIPLYNEKNTILNLIERIQEINQKEIKIIKHEKNQGYGVALLSGFRHATGDIIVKLISSCILYYILRKLDLGVNRFFLKKTIHYFYSKVKRKSIYNRKNFKGVLFGV